MLGSAVQNVVALTDSVFLYHRSETDFAAIGFVGVFYLVIAAIGFGFSKGGQIMIARRAGEADATGVGKSFHAMLSFSMLLAIVMFFFMQYGAKYIFEFLVQSPAIYEKSLEYLEPRSYGVFFSYIGVSLIALYTGIARTTFIIIDTIILAVVNGILNYCLIYGHWGFPELGIAGAGWASTIAEGIAFAAFVIYMVFDKYIHRFRLFKVPRIRLKMVTQLLSISSPVVVQNIVGLGSWFVFFGLIENMGERELAISNIGRIVYLILSIPVWGYATGINTLVSQFIGMQKRQAVVPLILKTAKITLATTMAIALPVVLFPKIFLYPLFGGSSEVLLTEAQPVLLLLLVILGLFSFGGIYFNGLTGTGATGKALFVQVVCTAFYLAYVFIAVKVFHAGLLWVWGAEIVYWLVALGLTHLYIFSRSWYGTEV
jgi:putative MATE family efflux protein